MADVLIVSIAAGGGHKAAMFSLAETLRRYTPHLITETLESRVHDVETLHRFSYTANDALYNVGYQASDFTLVQTLYRAATYPILRALADELRPLVATQRYTTIISTHFLQTMALLLLKHETGDTSRIVSYVPDFDDSSIHFPAYKHVLPDAALAQSPRFLAKVRKKYGLPTTRLKQAGFVPRSEFTASRSMPVLQARQNLASWSIPFTMQPDVNAFTLTVAGGSYWVLEVYEQVKRVAESAVFRWESAQILVACGNNTDAYRKYTELHHTLHAENPHVCIIPLPFLNYEQMATLYRASDAVLLSGLAPATMYELIETSSAVPFIHRINPGPERYNLHYCVQHNLGHYVPDAEDLRTLIERCSWQPAKLDMLRQNFVQAAVVERDAAQFRARETADFIAALTTEHHAPVFGKASLSSRINKQRLSQSKYANAMIAKMFDKPSVG